MEKNKIKVTIEYMNGDKIIRHFNSKEEAKKFVSEENLRGFVILSVIDCKKTNQL